MSNYITNDTELTAIANAIRGATGKTNSLIYPDDFIQAIEAIDTNPSTKRNNVNFLDYDGTIRYSYSKSEFANLTSMPDNPSHDGLTAQGWNWSLSDAKTYVAKYGRLDIGQMYITDDGKTRVYIHLEQGRTSPMLGVCPDGSVDVDWGDGTAHDTLTGTSTTTVQWTPTHNYAAPGDYVIQLTVTGSMGFYGDSDQGSGLLRYASGYDNRNKVYQTAIQRIEIGRGVISIEHNAFEDCYSLASITIPNSVTSIERSAFRYCRNLASISIPDSLTNIGTAPFFYCYNLTSISIPDSVTSTEGSMFNDCYSLTSISIPDGVTSIGTYAFQNCYSLASISIPDSITIIWDDAFYGCYNLANINIPDSVINIEGYAFRNCYGVSEYHFASTTPPTLSSTSAFTGIAADCIMYVPVGSLEAYQTATNWSSYSDYMQEEPS